MLIGLEVVGIDQGDRQRRRRAGAAKDFGFGQTIHRPPIRQSGQRVGQRHFLQHRVALFQLSIRVFEFAGPVGDAFFELEIELTQLVEQVFVTAFEQERHAPIGGEGPPAVRVARV